MLYFYVGRTRSGRTRNDMGQEPYYFNLEKRERELELNYMLSSLLKTRIRMGISDEPDPEEDVNVYLAHLLVDFAQPDYRERAERYLGETDVEVIRRVDASRDNSWRFHIYKLNADHLLLSVGVLERVGERLSRASRGRDCDFYIGRGKTYYEIASGYQERIYRKETALGETLDRLSTFFEKYVGILGKVRGDYFHLVRQLSEGQVSRLLEELKAYEDESGLREKRDQFLDLYSEWLKTRQEPLRLKLDELAKEIRVIDPHFDFPKAA